MARTKRRALASLASLAALTAATTVTGVAASTSASATSSVGGAITPGEMMSRAQFWVANHVPYNQSAYTADPEGTTYREDCSGFVSMAWHLGTSLVVTDGGPSFTNSDGSPNTAYDTGVGAFTNLQQGDAMAYPHDHIFLFDNWTNKATGDFTYYAESNPSDPTHGPTPANINNSTLEGWATSGYVGLRYKNVDTTPVTINSGNTSDSTWSVYNPDTKTMTLFGLGGGGHLGFTKSTNGGASWSNWAEANAYWTLQGNPNAIYDPDTKTTMLFARGSANGAMGISTSNNNGASWSNWTQVNAYWSNFKGDASAVYNPDTKKVTVFARGGDGKIGYTQSSNGGASWSNWAEVNAYWNNFAGDPHAIYNPNTKQITVFARGGDGKIGYTQSANDGASWSNWAEVNAYWNNFAGDPHILLNPDTKQITVFARGGDGKIGYTQSSNDGASWSNWAEVNAYWNNFAGDPHPVYNAATKTISLLARGGDGRIGYTQSGNGGASWSNWAEVNAYWNNFASDPVETYDPDTSQNTAFALGGGGHMGYTQSNGSGWTNWSEVNAYWTLVNP
ncbi:hypothetical protein ACWC2T_33950 [Streptomyces sp. NPDC001393]